MNPDDAGSHAQIAEVLEQCDSALRAKDLDALGECYAQDATVFDVGTQLSGYDGLRAVWEACFPYFPNPIGCERRDMRLEVRADVAVASFLSRMRGMDSDHPSARSWLRTTVCLRRTEGRWRIFHEHSSLPVDCGAEKPAYILDES